LSLEFDRFSRFLDTKISSARISRKDTRYLLRCRISLDIARYTWHPRHYRVSWWRNHRKNILRSVFDCSEPQFSNGAVMFVVEC